MYFVRQNYSYQLGNNMRGNLEILWFLIINQYTSLGNKLLGMDI